MDGENLGLQEKETGAGAAAENAGAQADSQEQTMTDGGMSGSANGVAGENGADLDAGCGTEDGVSHEANATFERQLKERDTEIAQLKAQVTEAAKSAEKETIQLIQLRQPGGGCGAGQPFRGVLDALRVFLLRGDRA